jgi:uncharacterized membrane protein YfcA
MPDPALLLALLVVLLAAVVKGALGMGFPLIAVPVLSLVLDPRTAVVVMSLPTLLANVGIVFRGGGKDAAPRRVLALLGGTVVGTAIGARLLAGLDVRLLSVVLGALAVIGALANASPRPLRVPPRLEVVLSPLVGLASGLLGGATSIFAPPLAVYLQGLRLGPRTFVFVLTLCFTVGGVTQALSYWQLGLYSERVLALTALVLGPMAAGVWLGLRLQDRLPAGLFNRLVLLLVVVSGLNLIVRGLSA